MKKILLLALIALCGCDTGTGECDGAYFLDFIVKNDTDQEIVVSESTSDPIVIVTDESKLIESVMSLGGCDRTTVLEDKLHAADCVIGLPGEYFPVFSMTVEGVKISDEIWLRKYWEFTSDFSTATYTLTVTDELLASLPAAE